jgi:hypothetical protein
MHALLAFLLLCLQLALPTAFTSAVPACKACVAFVQCLRAVMCVLQVTRGSASLVLCACDLATSLL